jgi:trehalose 6-phosphate synthase/phosphatase
MTKATDSTSAPGPAAMGKKPRAGGSNTDGISPDPSPGSFSTGANDTVAKSGLAPRPSLHPRLSSSRLSAVASGSYNDHGRGGESSDVSSLLGKCNGPVLPETLHAGKRVSYVSDTDRGSGGESGTASPTERQCSHGMRHSRFATGGTNPSKSSSPWIARSASRRRRTASIIGRKLRRPSQELANFPEADDDLGDTEYSTYEELPPHGFISNPSSNGGLVNAVACLAEQRKVRSGGRLFIGTPGFHADEEWLRPHHRRALQHEFREERSSVPVWLNEEVFRGAYHKFCKGILWPTFHYTLPTDKALEAEHESFECYKEVNMVFAKRIAQEWKEGDIILIND